MGLVVYFPKSIGFYYFNILVKQLSDLGEIILDGLLTLWLDSNFFCINEY